VETSAITNMQFLIISIYPPINLETVPHAQLEATNKTAPKYILHQIVTNQSSAARPVPVSTQSNLASPPKTINTLQLRQQCLGGMDPAGGGDK